LKALKRLRREFELRLLQMLAYKLNSFKEALHYHQYSFGNKGGYENA